MAQYIRFAISNIPMYGRIDGDKIEILAEPYWKNIRPSGKFVDREAVRLICPVQPTKIICIGLNYKEHVKHSQSATEVPTDPVLFFKPTSSLIGPDGNIVYPDWVDRVDYEAELALVIGKQGFAIPEDKAMDHVFGYTCVNDVTARKIQKSDKQWTRGKGFDTFCPAGPHVVTDIDVSDVQVEAYLNGEQKQCGRTSDLIFPIPFLISYISSVMTLMPGDIISTGTPQGIDPMQKGDSVEVRVEKIGSLFNTVV